MLFLYRYRDTRPANRPAHKATKLSFLSLRRYSTRKHFFFILYHDPTNRSTCKLVAGIFQKHALLDPGNYLPGVFLIIGQPARRKYQNSLFILASCFTRLSSGYFVRSRCIAKRNQKKLGGHSHSCMRR